MKTIRSLCVSCFLCTLAFSSQTFADPARTPLNKELVFGVLPFLSPVVLLKRFTPLKNYLEQATGKKIYLESAPNFAEYVKRTNHQQYNIIFTAPHFVPLALDGDHYEIAAASKKLAAHIMVKKDSPLTSLEQLAGKRIAIGPQEAFVVIIARRMLQDNGLTGKRAPVYKSYKSHNATLRTLEFNDADAAVIGSYLLDKAIKQGYRQLGATPYYPGAAFLLSKKMPEALREKISDAIVKMNQSDEGRRTLQLIKFPGFRKVEPEKYAPLRSIANTILTAKPSGSL